MDEAGAAEEGKSMAKPSGAGKKKTKVVRVKQAYIDRLLTQFPLKPFVGMPEELIETMSPEKREPFRTFMAEVVACVKASQGKDEAILKQYHAMGYAEEEIEVRDDGEEDEHDGRQCSIESKL